MTSAEEEGKYSSFAARQLFYNCCAAESLGPVVVVDLKNQNNTSLAHKGVMIFKRFKNA